MITTDQTGMKVKRIRGRTLPQWALCDMPAGSLGYSMRVWPAGWSNAEVHRCMVRSRRHLRTRVRRAAVVFMSP
jgi:hypothetical protein